MGADYLAYSLIDWKWGYFGALGVMAAVAVAMLGYFRKKHYVDPIWKSPVFSRGETRPSRDTAGQDPPWHIC